MKEEQLNKTIASFQHEDKYYEIDWLTDADYGDGFREYDIFEGKGKSANQVCHISSKIYMKSYLIKEAKNKLNN